MLHHGLLTPSDVLVRRRLAGRSTLSTQRHHPVREIAILLHRMAVIAAAAPIEDAHCLPAAGRVQRVGVIRAPAGAAASDSRPHDWRRERPPHRSIR